MYKYTTSTMHKFGKRFTQDYSGTRKWPQGRQSQNWLKLGKLSTKFNTINKISTCDYRGQSLFSQIKIISMNIEF